MPIGTLMNRPHRQDSQSVSMPPATRPTLAPPEDDRAVQADRPQPIRAFGEARREQGKGRRRGDGGADSLDRTGGQQLRPGLGEPAEQRRDREDGYADREHAAAPEDVARAGAE